MRCFLIWKEICESDLLDRDALVLRTLYLDLILNVKGYCASLHSICTIFNHFDRLRNSTMYCNIFQSKQLSDKLKTWRMTQTIVRVIFSQMVMKKLLLTLFFICCASCIDDIDPLVDEDRQIAKKPSLSWAQVCLTMTAVAPTVFGIVIAQRFNSILFWL